MKKNISNSFVKLFACLLFLAYATINSVSGAGENYLRRYSEDNFEIRQLCLGVNNPSSESKRVQLEIIGRWKYVAEFSSVLSNIVWQFLVFEEDGSVAYSYKLKNREEIESKTESYQLVHKGMAEKLEGKAPNIVLKRKDVSDGSVIVFVGVSVDYDNRLPIRMGEVLKFTDVEGNRFLFIREKTGEDDSDLRQRKGAVEDRDVESAKKNLGGYLRSGRISNPDVTAEVLITLQKTNLSEHEKNKAILRLMNEGDSSCVPFLIKCLPDDQPMVIRQNAIRALGKIGDKRAVKPLLNILEQPIQGNTDDEDEIQAVLRRCAVIALGEIRDESALSTLQRIADSGSEYQSVRELAQDAIKKIKLK